MIRPIRTFYLSPLSILSIFIDPNAERSAELVVDLEGIEYVLNLPYVSYALAYIGKRDTYTIYFDRRYNADQAHHELRYELLSEMNRTQLDERWVIPELEEIDDDE